jgi:hypothetical protein
MHEKGTVMPHQPRDTGYETKYGGRDMHPGMEDDRTYGFIVNREDEYNKDFDEFSHQESQQPQQQSISYQDSGLKTDNSKPDKNRFQSPPQTGEGQNTQHGDDGLSIDRTKLSKDTGTGSSTRSQSESRGNMGARRD